MRRRLIASLAVTAVGVVAVVGVVIAVEPAPRLSLWYRGEPPGIARAADLAAIRAAGFTAVVWPSSETAGLAEATRLSAEAGLELVERPAPVALTSATARHAGATVDIVTAGVQPAAITPLVWRAIAHGARDVSIDPGIAGTHVLAQPANTPAWALAAGEIARQLRINGKLFADAVPSVDQPTTTAPSSGAVDIVLLDVGRVWVLVATNMAGTRTRLTAHLPTGVPYAIWLNLLNGDTLAMLNEPSGPRWSFELEGWGTRIYVIDKGLK